MCPQGVRICILTEVGRAYYRCERQEIFPCVGRLCREAERAISYVGVKVPRVPLQSPDIRMEIVLPARDNGDEKRSETRSRLSERAADGFDGRTRPTRALEDLAILRFDKVARRGIPAQAAQRGAGNFAVRGDCPILIEHVEQHEFRPRCWFPAAHLVSSF